MPSKIHKEDKHQVMPVVTDRIMAEFKDSKCTKVTDSRIPSLMTSAQNRHLETHKSRQTSSLGCHIHNST